MTLLDLCEPLFLFVCKINRSKRKGGPAFDPGQLRTEVDRILRGMVQKAAADRDLSRPFTQIKPVLLCFVDGMASHALPGKWDPVGASDQRGDEYFFAQLDAAIADPSPGGKQRLTVFYTCLGLGYAQWKPEDERATAERVNKVAGHIQEFMDLDPKKKLVQAAYENIDTRMLEPPLAQRIAGVAILLIGLLLIAFLANAMLYREKTRGLNGMMNGVMHAQPAAQSPAGS